MLQVPCLRCCTTVEVGVELNPGCFSRLTAISRLLVCLPFALRVHENCRVKSSWCIPGEKRAAKYCSVEPCSRTASHWPGVFHNNREAQEPWCIWSFFFSPYQLGAAFVLLCSSEVPVKSHIHGVLAVGCPCKSLLRLPRSCWGDSEPLAQVQRHPRALLVPFELGCEGYIPSSLTNTNGRFAQTCDVNV